MVVDAVDQLRLRSAILDGEVVALDAEGIPDSNCFKNGKNAQLLRLPMSSLICFGITGVT